MWIGISQLALALQHRSYHTGLVPTGNQAASTSNNKMRIDNVCYHLVNQKGAYIMHNRAICNIHQEHANTSTHVLPLTGLNELF